MLRRLVPQTIALLLFCWPLHAEAQPATGAAQERASLAAVYMELRPAQEIVDEFIALVNAGDGAAKPGNGEAGAARKMLAAIPEIDHMAIERAYGEILARSFGTAELELSIEYLGSKADRQLGEELLRYYTALAQTLASEEARKKDGTTELVPAPKTADYPLVAKAAAADPERLEKLRAFIASAEGRAILSKHQLAKAELIPIIVAELEKRIAERAPPPAPTRQPARPAFRPEPPEETGMERFGDMRDKPTPKPRPTQPRYYGYGEWEDDEDEWGRPVGPEPDFSGLD